MWVHSLLAICLAALPLAAPALDREHLETLKRMEQLADTVDGHLKSTGSQPANAAHLGVLTRLYTGPMRMQGGVPVDLWDRPFVYRPSPSSDAEYALYSLGPNGLDEQGEGDDVRLGALVAPTSELLIAQQLFPFVVLVTVGPIAYAAIRRAKRAAGC